MSNFNKGPTINEDLKNIQDEALINQYIEDLISF
jgi:hypothetical protein